MTPISRHQMPPLAAGRCTAGLLLLLALSLLAAGCGGSDLATVTGTVTVDGEPAKVGAIAFFAADGRAPSAGAPIIDGRYSAEVSPGLCHVQIRVSKVVGEKRIYDTPDSPVRKIWAEALPPKFNDNTELELDIRPGTNEKNYDLSTKE